MSTANGYLAEIVTLLGGNPGPDYSTVLGRIATALETQVNPQAGALSMVALQQATSDQEVEIDGQPAAAIVYRAIVPGGFDIMGIYYSSEGSFEEPEGTFNLIAMASGWTFFDQGLLGGLGQRLYVAVSGSEPLYSGSAEVSVFAVQQTVISPSGQRQPVHLAGAVTLLLRSTV